jgi:hypothetical protein
MKKICVTDAIKLIEPIAHDEVAMSIIDMTHSIVTSGATCEMEHCSDRKAKAIKN